MARRTTPPFFYLRPDETVIARITPEKEWALAMFFTTALILTTLEAMLLFAAGQFPQVPSWATPVIIGVYAVLLVFAAFVSWRLWATSEYALTDSRIYARHGRLRTRVHFTTHDRITDIRYHQGPLERVFGISRIVFATAGGDVAVLGVRDAIVVKEQAETARDAFIQDLLERAGVDHERRERTAREERARPLPRDVDGVEIWTPVEEPAAPRVPWPGPRPDYLKAGDEPEWFGKPAPISAVSAILPLVGIAPIILISGWRGGGSLFTWPVLLLIAAGLIAYRIMQLRRMEYTVTDKRVYTRSGVIGTTVTQLTYDKITDITYRQDLLGRLFGFGGVTVNTAGSNQAPVTMVGLTKPLEVKALIEAARSRYLREEDETP